MFQVERKPTRTRFIIRILKTREKEFAKFRRELQTLLRKHKVQQMRRTKAKRTRRRK